MIKNNFKKRFLFFVIDIFLFLIFCIFFPSIISAQEFEQQSFEYDLYRLFDLGVTDINEDGNLDFFSANHNALQTIIFEDGTGGFSDNQIATLGLSQDIDFPSLEVSHPPEISDEGVYIFWSEMDIFIVFIQGENCLLCNIEMTLNSEIDIIKNENFFSNKEETELFDGLIETKLILVSFLDSHMRIDPDYKAIPIHFSVNLPADHIFIGSQKVNPNSSEFTIQLQDRHGHAWGDYNLDEKTDVFIARGGLQGDMSFFPEEYNYELFQGDLFVDIINQTGIDMKDSRSRQVAMVDYNNDGLPDYYVGCKESENQLWEQQLDGTFVDVAVQYELNKIMTGAFKWFDWGKDNDMDLIIVNTKGVLLFENTGMKFVKIILCEFGGNYESYSISSGDIDNDGDVDFLLSSFFEGNMIIRNDNTEMVCIDPAQYNLPRNSANAILVDIFNDGDLDVWTPDGIYKQKINKKFFLYTDELAVPYPTDVVLCAWADFDNDGDRDCIFAYEKENKLNKWRVRYYTNEIEKNNWIQLDFSSRDLGTKVTITAGDLVQYSEVGCSENSRFSQGHYRVYFGLKEWENINQIKIERLNGTTEIMENVKPNQILF